MGNKRFAYDSQKHFWHLSWGKARRLNKLFDIVESERDALLSGIGVDTKANNDKDLINSKIKGGTLK